MLFFLKNDKDIEGFATAGRIAASILRKLRDAAKPGVSTAQLDELAREECKKAGADPVFLGYHGFPAAICASVNDVLVHGIPNDTPLKQGDVLSIDIGTSVDGFIGDNACTLLVGGVGSACDISLIKYCGASLEAGIAAARPGQMLSDVSRAMSEVVRRSKFRMVTDYGGHGIERGKLHGDPFVPNEPVGGSADVELRPGMVLALEPMLVSGKDNSGKTDPDGWTIRVADGNAVHFEKTIAITAKGPVVLTKEENA